MDTTPVVIDDDDAISEDQCKVVNIDTENTHEAYNLARRNSFIDIIDLDGEPESAKNEHAASNNVWVNTFENIESKNDAGENFAKLLKSNTLMNKIVTKCLGLKNNKGMSRVINKTLLPLYKNTSSEFKMSDIFLTFLSKTLHNLKHDPNFKFSHLQSLCQILRNSKDKKKVPFITLSKDIKKLTAQIESEAPKENNVIDLVNLDIDKVITLIDDDTDKESDDVMIVDETNDSDNKGGQSNKENCNLEKVNNKAPSESHIDVDNLLVPIKSVAASKRDIAVMKIEKEIEQLKVMIDELEQKEVTDDWYTSPYLQCDKHKAKIVSLYKKLCKLTGNDVNLKKKLVVRLQALEGHPPGPARRLEQFLNNTSENGSIQMPDFHDVVECVKKSNIIDKLDWNNQKIIQEALALFNLCGQALRKNRQMREYKDLMSLVHAEVTDDHDPANEDPALFARLEENKCIAKANEEEIIERYAKLGDAHKVNSFTRSVECVRVEPTVTSDPDSESEFGVTPSKRIKTGIETSIKQNTNNSFQNHFSQFVSSTYLHDSSHLCVDTTMPTVEKPKSKHKEETFNQHTPQGDILRRRLTCDVPSENNKMPIITEIKTLTVENNSIETHIPKSDFSETPEFEIDYDLASGKSIVSHGITLSPLTSKDQGTIRQNTLQITSLSNLITFDSDLPSENNIPINRESNLIKTEITEFNSDEIQTFENHFNESRNVENNVYKALDNTNSIENLGISITDSINDHISIKQEETFRQNTMRRISLSNLITFDSEPASEKQLIPINSKINLVGPELIENYSSETQIVDNNLNIKEKLGNNLFEQSESGTIPPSIYEHESNIQRESFIKNTLQEINMTNLETFDSDLPLENNIDATKTQSNLIKTEIIENNFNETQDLESDLNKTQTLENNNKELDSNNSLENHDITPESDNVTKQATIKQEPIDVASLLYNLGDKYFTTIFDIEDPFLVIEISSGSSSEDEL